MIKLLYLSFMHPTLEYDECMVFEELGIDWFSTGIYMYPRETLSHLKLNSEFVDNLNLRKPIDKDSDLELINKYLNINTNYRNQLYNLDRPSPKLTKEFVDHFDIIISNHYNYIVNNWEVIKNKPVIWRTIGDWNRDAEQKMKPYTVHGNISIARFSENEFYIENSNKGRVIRNYVDESLYNNWTGGINKVLLFQNHFYQRKSFKVNKAFLSICDRIPYILHGAYVGYNDPRNSGPVDWDTQVKLYKTCDCFLYLGSNTPIVAYTFMEALMTGIPLISFGPSIGGILTQDGKLIHEPSQFIENEVDGFYSDNLETLIDYVNTILYNEDIRVKMSNKAREKAIKYFSKARAVREWGDLFNDILGANLC